MYRWELYIDNEFYFIVWLKDGSDLAVMNSIPIFRVLCYFTKNARNVLKKDLNTLKRSISYTLTGDRLLVKFKDSVAFSVDDSDVFDHSAELTMIDAIFAFSDHWVVHMSCLGLIFVRMSDMGFAGSISYKGRDWAPAGENSGVCSRFLLLHKDVFKILGGD